MGDTVEFPEFAYSHFAWLTSAITSLLRCHYWPRRSDPGSQSWKISLGASKEEMIALPGLQHGAGAKMPVGDPQLAGLRAVQQRRNRGTLAHMRVLAGHEVAHQAAVRVIHHQRLP